jgi:hypothetical protein
MKFYTVLLLYLYNTDGPGETYQAHVEAKSPSQAAKFAQAETDQETKVMAIYAGYLDDLSGEI